MDLEFHVAFSETTLIAVAVILIMTVIILIKVLNIAKDVKSIKHKLRDLDQELDKHLDKIKQ